MTKDNIDFTEDQIEKALQDFEKTKSHLNAMIAAAEGFHSADDVAELAAKMFQSLKGKELSIGMASIAIVLLHLIHSAETDIINNAMRLKCH